MGAREIRFAGGEVGLGLGFVGGRWVARWGGGVGGEGDPGWILKDSRRKARCFVKLIV